MKNLVKILILFILSNYIVDAGKDKSNLKEKDKLKKILAVKLLYTEKMHPNYRCMS